MRKLIIQIFLTILCLSAEADNKALLIGIGDYPKETGWNTISSVNDIDILKSAQPSTFTIQTLTNEEATHQEIIKALEELTKCSQQSDTIFIHFSCHGQQMVTNDTNEPDHLDEALIPFDAYKVKSSNYDGSHHLTDNELGVLINKLRKNVGRGGLIIVTLDACFSDSMDKGTKKAVSDSIIYRGCADIFGSNEISADSLNHILSKRTKMDSLMVDSMENGADIVVLSACKSYQKNYEVKIMGVGYGSLSYSLVQSLEKNSFCNIKDWVVDVFQYMNKYAYTQQPQLRTTLDITIEQPKSTSSEKPIDNNTRYPIIIVLGLLSTFIAFGFIWKRTVRK